MRRFPKIAVVSGGAALFAVAAISGLASVPAIPTVSQGIDLDIEASSSASALAYATGQVNVCASTGAVVVAGHPSRVNGTESTGGDIYVLG